MNSNVRSVAAAAVVLCAGVSASARQPEKDTKAGPVISGAARPILEKQLRALQVAKSVSGEMTFTWTMKAEGQDPQTRTNKETFAVAKPDRVYMKTDEVEVIADSKTLTVYVPRLKQYIAKPAPSTDSLADEIGELTGGRISTVVCEEVIRPGITLEQSLRRFKSLDGVKAGTDDGKPGTWISGKTAGEEGRPEVKIEVFFPEGQALKSRIRLDYTAFYADRPAMGDDEEPAKVTSAGWDISYKSVEIDKDLPADRFAFKPGALDKKVDEFGAPSMPSQNSMLGLAAPAFEGQDLDGKDLKLADLKGSVVVLDFWATWCGPCMQAIPKVQELKDKYAGRPVVFLGMNTDAPGSSSKVKKTLTNKKITIRQFDDSGGTASQAYGVTGIPCMVMIDKAGVVQNIHVGFAPGEEEELAEEIDKMLEGKALRSEEEFKKAREGGGEAGGRRPARRGGGNDVMSRGHKADDLMQSGKFDEAADEYVWLWKHALENDPAYYGVRLSFMASSMEELAHKSPKAKEKFTALRDETGKLLDEPRVDSRTDMDNAVDWVALNKIVGDTDRTLAWIDKVKDERRWRPVLQRIGRDVEEVLAKNNRWESIGRLYTDPIHELEKDYQIAMMVPGERPGGKAGQKPKMQSAAAQMLRQRAGRIYAGLLAAKREDDAAKFAAKARELDPSPSMVRYLVNTAERAGQARPEHAKWQEADESDQKKP